MFYRILKNFLIVSVLLHSTAGLVHRYEHLLPNSDGPVQYSSVDTSDQVGHEGKSEKDCHLCLAFISAVSALPSGKSAVPSIDPVIEIPRSLRLLESFIAHFGVSARAPPALL